MAFLNNPFSSENDFSIFSSPSSSQNVDNGDKYKIYDNNNIYSNRRVSQTNDNNSYNSQETNNTNNKTTSNNTTTSIDSCIPVSISLLKKSLNDEKHKQLTIHNTIPGQITLCGWLTNVSIKASQAQFTLCDGSGSINVNFGFQDSNKFSDSSKKTQYDNNNNNDDNNINSKKEKSTDCIIKTESSFYNDDSDEENISQKNDIKKFKNVDWRAKCLINGKLIRVVGVGLKVKGGMCFIEASYIRAIDDVKEYIEYHDVEICYAAMSLLRTQNNDSWEFKPLPSSFNHIKCNNKIQLIKYLYYGCDKCTITQDRLFERFKNKISSSVLTEALTELEREGDIAKMNDTIALVKDEED